jgi:hypothetical protein
MTTGDNLDQLNDLELAQELLRLLLHSLLRRLRSKPSAGFLEVARKTLKDRGAISLASGDRHRKHLERLYSLYLRRLTEALNDGKPSSAVFAEVRHFLHDQGISREVSRRNPAAVLEALASAPFKH